RARLRAGDCRRRPLTSPAGFWLNFWRRIAGNFIADRGPFRHLNRHPVDMIFRIYFNALLPHFGPISPPLPAAGGRRSGVAPIGQVLPLSGAPWRSRFVTRATPNRSRAIAMSRQSRNRFSAQRKARGGACLSLCLTPVSSAAEINEGSGTPPNARSP